MSPWFCPITCHRLSSGGESHSVCPPRAHTGGGGRQKSHKICPTYLFTLSWQAPALCINPSKQLENCWLNVRPEGSTRTEVAQGGWRARERVRKWVTSAMQYIFHEIKSYLFFQFNHNITGKMNSKIKWCHYLIISNLYAVENDISSPLLCWLF